MEKEVEYLYKNVFKCELSEGGLCDQIKNIQNIFNNEQNLQ